MTAILGVSANSPSGASPPTDFVVPLQPIENEAPAKLIVGVPLHEQLAKGRAVIPYRTENLIIRPVYGEAARMVSPRIGHIHITVDDLPWHWADGSGEPVIITSLTPGPHKVLIQLEDPTHKPLDEALVTFEIPDTLQPR